MPFNAQCTAHLSDFYSVTNFIIGLNSNYAKKCLLVFRFTKLKSLFVSFPRRKSLQTFKSHDYQLRQNKAAAIFLPVTENKALHNKFKQVLLGQK